MTEKPQSPYKSQQVQLKEVCFSVSSQDLKDFRFRFATHGSIDAIMATLVYHFTNAAREFHPRIVTGKQKNPTTAVLLKWFLNLSFPSNHMSSPVQSSNESNPSGVEGSSTDPAKIGANRVTSHH